MFLISQKAGSSGHGRRQLFMKLHVFLDIIAQTGEGEISQGADACNSEPDHDESSFPFICALCPDGPDYQPGRPAMWFARHPATRPMPVPSMEMTIRDIAYLLDDGLFL